MAYFRAIVQYHFKKGMADQGLKFLENELIKKAQNLGCHHVELLQDDIDPSYFVGIAVWNSLEEAKKFQHHFSAKEKEILKFCSKEPTRHFCRVRSHFEEKSKKAA